jgi:hypothetical protein
MLPLPSLLYGEDIMGSAWDKYNRLVRECPSLVAVYNRCYGMQGKSVVISSDEGTGDLISEHLGKIGTVVDFEGDGSCIVEFGDGTTAPFFGNEIKFSGLAQNMTVFVNS